MRSAHVVEIITPKKVVLNGLWFGPKKASNVVIWVHGLGSSAFTKLYIVDELVDKDTAVITFNNRGHDKISSTSSGRNKRIRGGAAHEIFTDCVDDIEGAIRFAKRTGARAIWLAGHSTGCQKSAYWAAKKGTGVEGIVLLAPMSDYASEIKAQGIEPLRRAEKEARKLMRAGRPHELLPERVWSWSWMTDAQRFISLYSGESAEEIFTYWNSKRNPKTLRSVLLPVLVLLAEKDEYGDRPAKKIGDWFAEHLKVGDRVVVVPRVKHSFKGAEKQVAKLIKGFMQA